MRVLLTMPIALTGAIALAGCSPAQGEGGGGFWIALLVLVVVLLALGFLSRRS